MSEIRNYPLNSDTLAVIIAGGLGIRLRSILGACPKPMAPIAGRPFLTYLLLQLRKQCVENIILLVGYQSKMIEAFFRNGGKWNLHLVYSKESKPMGTGGALKLAESLIDSEYFLIMNGDSFFHIDLNTLIRFHRNKRSLATIALANVENTERYGAVEINEEGEIMRFLEKEQTGRTGLINGGIYVFQRDVLDLIPEGQAVSLEREIFPRLIGKGLYGLPFQGYFVDIGVPADYLRLRADPSRLLAAVGLDNYVV